MSSRPDIHLELTSNPLFLSGVRELISAVARRIGFHDKNCSQIALAVDEALCNVMRHGYDKRTDGRIWISLHADPAANGSATQGVVSLKIIIEDEARQVDPVQIKGRDLDDVKPGGLGVHIIRQVMDEAVYEKRPGAGMRLTMLKRQPAGAPAPSSQCGTGCGCRPS